MGIVNKIIWKYGIKFTDIFKIKKLFSKETLNDNHWKIKIVNELLDYNERVNVAGFLIE